MKTLTATFELTDEQYDHLLKIREKGFAEYRDTEYETLEDFKKSEIFQESGVRNEGWYLKRNFNGTLQLSYKLYDMGLLTINDMSWHTTYVLSDLAENCLTKI